MKRVTLTADERELGHLLIAETLTRPSCHLAMMWLERLGARPSRTGYPFTVGELALLLHMCWGVRVEIETMAVALETLGFKLAMRTMHPELQTELSTNVRRREIPTRPWRTEDPADRRTIAARLARYSDPSGPTAYWLE